MLELKRQGTSTFIYVTRHEKTRLMYTKYTSSYYVTYLLYYLRYCNSVNFIRFLMKYCINGRNYISLLFIPAKLFKFEITKCGQILCAHKPYFLSPLTYAIKNELSGQFVLVSLSDFFTVNNYACYKYSYKYIKLHTHIYIAMYI